MGGLTASSAFLTLEKEAIEGEQKPAQKENEGRSSENKNRATNANPGAPRIKRVCLRCEIKPPVRRGVEKERMGTN